MEIRTEAYLKVFSAMASDAAVIFLAATLGAQNLMLLLADIMFGIVALYLAIFLEDYILKHAYGH